MTKCQRAKARERREERGERESYTHTHTHTKEATYQTKKHTIKVVLLGSKSHNACNLRVTW
jgi:hypothetical protein